MEWTDLEWSHVWGVRLSSWRRWYCLWCWSCKEGVWNAKEQRQDLGDLARNVASIGGQEGRSSRACSQNDFRWILDLAKWVDQSFKKACLSLSYIEKCRVPTPNRLLGRWIRQKDLVLQSSSSVPIYQPHLPKSHLLEKSPELGHEHHTQA